MTRVPRRRRLPGATAIATATATATALALALVASACSSSAHRAHPPSGTTVPRTAPALRATAAGYTVPAPLTAAAPGALIGARDAGAQAAAVGAGHAWQVLYHSTDLARRDIAVSGLVLVPRGAPPASGWPVIAWAHGTSGLADQCAPSIAAGLAHDPTAVREVRALVGRGWAVVASDYPGLGTPGVHTYLIGAADARAVIDSVTAAHALLGARVSRSWLTVGHSEGGQTALFVAQAATTRAPQWKFLGTVALAPASTLDALIPLTEATHDPVEEAYLIYALEGLTTVDSGIHVASLLTSQARSVLPDTTTGCIDDITNDLRRRHVDHVMAAGPATLTALNLELARYDNPDHARAPEPVLIAQGTADQDVPSPATDGLVTRLCALGDHLVYRRYPGLDHGGVVAGSLDFATAWIRARLAGVAPASTCPRA